jgi:hypothetical protein
MRFRKDAPAVIPLDVNVIIDTWRRDRRGQWVREHRQVMHNMVTLAGFNLVRDLLGNVAVPGLSYFGLGTGTTAPVITDAALEAEVFRDALTGLTFDAGLLTASYFLGAASANGNTLSEIGLFTHAAGGTLFARALLSQPFAKTVDRQATFNWYIGINSTGEPSLSFNRFMGFVVTLGGSASDYSYQTGYPSGNSADKLVPNSEIWYMLPSDLDAGTYAIEAMMKTNNAAGQGTIALFNLDDAPDTVLGGSDVQGSVGQQTGEVVTSNPISFGSPISRKRFGVKVKSNNAAYGVAVWGIRVVQLS